MIPRFTVVRELGRGGQGRVLAVRDAARGDRELALKETSAPEASGLRDEFELLARLRHPNLGAVYDWFARSPLAPAGEQAPAAYTQDLVPGTDLYRALREAPLRTREVAFEQVLRALAYLHALGVVHLDLKPDNILVDVRSDVAAVRARVVDFGIAAPRGQTSDTVRGSLSYIAPERLRGAAVDPRADLFSLGVVMAEVWLGGPLQASAALSEASVRRGWLAERGVPEAWLDLIVALTSRDPAERPPNVYAASALWSRSLGRSVTLQTPGTVAAILRSAAPVGRDGARDACHAAVVSGGARVIVGPPGTGRRTLAAQIARRAQSRGHAAEWWPATPEHATVGDLALRLERLIGTDGGLSDTMSLAVDPTAGLGPGAGGRLQRAVEAAVRPIAEALVDAPASEPRPVLIVDRLGALPPPVEALIAQLVERAEEGRPLPLGLVVVADRHEGAAAVGLAPLGRADVARLLELRLGPSVATDALASSLTAASGGHPLTLENLLALLVARGELQFGPEGWTVSARGGDGHGIARSLPSEMEGAVRERVRLLGQEARAWLSSVAWLRFGATGSALSAVLGRSVSIEVLAELEAAGLLWRPEDGRWRCAHPQVAEAVGAWEPPGGAAAGHRRVLEAADDDGLVPLARAWHVGGESGTRAAVDLASEAWSAWLADEAARALDVALELSPRDEAALALRADVADLLGPRELEISCLHRLIDLRRQDGRPALEARARLFWALTRTAQAEEAEALGREVLDDASAAGRQDLWRAAVVDLANVVIQRGDYEEGRALLEAADLAVDPAHDPGLAARIANNLGNILAYRGQLDEALERYTRAWTLKVDEGDPVGERIALGNMGLMCLQLGRSGEALEHFRGSLLAARQLRHRRGEAWSLLALAVLGLEAGAARYARRRADLALELATQLGDRVVACDARTTLGEIHLALGDRRAAQACAELGLAEALEVDSGFNAGCGRAVCARAWLEDDAGRAERFARAVVEDTGFSDPAYSAAAWTVLAEVAVRRGDLAAASSAAAAAVDVAGRRPGLSVLVTAVRVARLVADAGRVAAASAQARQALAERAAAWPEATFDDGVDPEAAIDGPSRATWSARPLVKRLGHEVQGLSLNQSAGPTGGAGVPPAPGRDEMQDSGGRGQVWLQTVADADASALPGLLAEWLAGVVQQTGAERGFLVDGAGVPVAAMDADRDAVSDPAGKLPVAAVDEARRAGGPWRGATAGGRGSVYAVPCRDHVVVLQNRFVGDAFADLEPTLGGGAGAGALLLRLAGLLGQLEAAHARAEESERSRRSEATRSTEELLRLRRELETTREHIGPERDYTQIIFDSPAMKRMLRLVDRVLETDLPVWVHGESGTGKELVARALHTYGPRGAGPFVAQNCGAVPAALFESTFFGHERGAFTGAERSRPGLFRRADGGTIFLDEIGDLPLDMQTKLLRVLETGEVRAVGGQKVHQVDVRVVCATHQDLAARVADQTFREDLYYRLNVVRIDVPPLRDRPDDIPLLVEHFIAGRTGPDGAPVTLGKGVLKALIAHDWPGNVRELENEVTRASLLCDGAVQLSDLSDHVRGSRRGGRVRGSTRPGGAGDGLERLGLGRGLLRDRVATLEKLVLERTLARAEGNKSKVARELGLSRAGLNMKLKRLGLWEGEAG